MVGTLSEPQRHHFLDFLRTIGAKDSDAIIDAWWQMGVTEPDAQRPGLLRDLDHLFHRAGVDSELVPMFTRLFLGASVRHGIELTQIRRAIDRSLYRHGRVRSATKITRLLSGDAGGREYL